MSNRRRIAAALCLLALMTTSGFAAVELQVFPAPGYERVAASVASIPAARLEQARLFTGAPDLRIAVQIISESEAVERRVPLWVSGYAVSEALTVVLIPARAVTYPNDGIEDLVVHEATHILVDAAAGGGEVPRWFHEGVAMYVSTGWRLEDATRLTFTLWADSPASLGQVNRAFYSDYAAVARAYALSGSFVRRLVHQSGTRVISAILGTMASGVDFATAFRGVTGESLAEAEAEFWETQTRWSRWVPLLSSSVALWAGVTVLAVLAFRRRRRRDEQMLKQFDEEEMPEEPFEDSLRS